MLCQLFGLSRQMYQSALGLFCEEFDLEPRMLDGGVVHHHVKDDLHAAFVDFFDQL